MRLSFSPLSISSSRLELPNPFEQIALISSRLKARCWYRPTQAPFFVSHIQHRGGGTLEQHAVEPVFVRVSSDPATLQSVSMSSPVEMIVLRTFRLNTSFSPQKSIVA